MLLLSSCCLCVEETPFIVRVLLLLEFVCAGIGVGLPRKRLAEHWLDACVCLDIGLL